MLRVTKTVRLLSRCARTRRVTISVAGAMTVPINLLDLTPADALERLRQFATASGEPPYRAAQVVRHLWERPATDFASMTALPIALRVELAEQFAIPRLEILARQTSSDGTEKFLFRLPEGQEIETVAIPEGGRLTLCISSQAGCALQCAFCATGRMGFQRNLAAWEIAAQVREMALLDPPIAVTNVVFMGMGEPMMNWPAVDTALTILNSPQGLGIGARHITVSTVGVLPGIVALGERPEQFRLAISIHAPSDELRRELMPVNVKYPLRASSRRSPARAAPSSISSRFTREGRSSSRVRLPSVSRASRARCARPESRWRCERAAARTSPPRAASYG